MVALSKIKDVVVSATGTLIEPKYLPSGHCTVTPMIDVPHRDKPTSTPSVTSVRASRLPVGVDQRADDSVMSLSFMRGTPISAT